MKYDVRDYDEYWRPRLAGTKPPYVSGAVYLGFWIFKTNDHQNGGDPVAIWLDDNGDLHCKVNDVKDKKDEKYEVADLQNVFGSKSEDEKNWTRITEFMTWLLDRPVSSDDYWSRMEAGYWPWIHDEVGKKIAEKNGQHPGIGHNNPPTDIFSQMREEIERFTPSAFKLIQDGAAKTEKAAKQAGTVVDELRALNRKAEKAKKAEKDPHWEKCKEIEAKWKPLIEGSAIYARVNDVVVTPWLKKAEADRQAKIVAERAEADRIRRGAEEAARQAEETAKHAPVDNPEGAAEVEAAAAQAELLTKQADELDRKADQTAKNTVKLGGVHGKSISLHANVELDVVDRRAAAAFFKNDGNFLTELDEMLKRYARPIIKAGRQVPGIAVKTEQSAA